MRCGVQLWSVKYVCNRLLKTNTIRPCRRRRFAATWRSAYGAEPTTTGYELDDGNAPKAAI